MWWPFRKKPEPEPRRYEREWWIGGSLLVDTDPSYRAADTLHAEVNEGAGFFDHAVDLSGRRFVGCRFDGCVITLRWTPRGTHVERCHFCDCAFVGDPELVQALFGAGRRL